MSLLLSRRFAAPPPLCAAPFMPVGLMLSSLRRQRWRSLTSRLSGPGLSSIDASGRTAGRKKEQSCTPLTSRSNPVLDDRLSRACTTSKISCAVPATPRIFKYRTSSSPRGRYSPVFWWQGSPSSDFRRMLIDHGNPHEALLDETERPLIVDPHTAPMTRLLLIGAR
eukprot:COSAG06_NODE_258_length_18940_cov_15.039648_20_plen_167_part_00